MKKVETYGQIKGGKIHYTHLDKFKSAVFHLFGEGERFRVIYEKIYRKRSSPQNKYYWGVIINSYLEAFEQSQGYKLGVEVVNRETGQVIVIPLSEKEQAEQAHKELKSFYDLKTTTENTTTQQEEYHQFCRDYIQAVFNYRTPLPNEQTEIELK